MTLARSRVAGVTGGVTCAGFRWLVAHLSGLSHPQTYETIGLRNPIFWLVYTLGGFRWP